MTGVCTELKEVKMSRVQNVSHRRIPFEKKIGAGKTRKHFEDLVKKGIIRPVK
ncbi:MAG: hypothetical protein QME78_17485 [Thermodesulfobacteriota bacterium]|nr:hypothetical protein [Thermodesulfobacteriota bacterium]